MRHSPDAAAKGATDGTLDIVRVGQAYRSGLNRGRCVSWEPVLRIKRTRHTGELSANLVRRATISVAPNRNEGETAPPRTTSLTSLFLGAEVTSHAAPVVLTVQDGRLLRLEFPSTSGEPSTLVLAQGKLSCHEGKLTVHPGGHWVGGMALGVLAVGRQSRTLELYAIGDGLVIKERTSTLGMITAIPWKHAADTWHRFQRIAGH